MMEKYVNAFINEFTSTLNWTLDSILFKVPWYNNYFWGLIVISLVVWLLEIIFPWRKNQSSIRKDFWMDGFYMFFNFFIFSILISGDYKALGLLFNEIGITTKSLAVFNISNWPIGFQLVVFFVILDFVQWLTHVLLHKYEVLWRFHKVHHSVKEMGFAAHLRYHWMEPIVYNSLRYIPLAIIGGFSAQDVAVVHFFTITIGHLNHANINWDYGWLKYIFNNPKMHIWHHAKELPKEHKYGVNFGLTLSIWDYLFRTNYIPFSGRDIELGFENDEYFPKGFVKQELYPLGRDRDR